MKNIILTILTKKNIYFFVLIISWLVFFHLLSNIKKLPFIAVKQAQEYMKDVHVTHYTETGIVKDDITASYWEYLPKAEKSQLLHPILYVNKLNGIIWRIEAQHGSALHKTLESKIMQLDLWGNVIATRPATSNTEPIKVTGNILHYFPENEYITSNGQVKMEKPGLIITGTGLQGYLNKNWVEILSDVTTTYINQNS